MTERVRDQVLTIIARQALVEACDVHLTTTPDDLGLDSMGLVEAVFAIEECFDIQVPFNANDPAQGGFDISTVGAMVTAVEILIAEQRA